jgi:hypothetical protein
MFEEHGKQVLRSADTVDLNLDIFGLIWFAGHFVQSTS